MSTQQRVIGVLSGVEATRIRFTIPVGGGITINRFTFQRVAGAIKRGDVHVKVTTTFPAGVGAQYDPSTNTIETPPVIGRVDEGLVLHECTHAFFDLASTAIPALDDEATAYVVDALYFRMTGLPRNRWNAHIHAVAGSVANGLLKNYQAGTPGVPAVDAASWASLRQAIVADPVYINGPAGTGGSYLHNG
jgi:hypothetical protein